MKTFSALTYADMAALTKEKEKLSLTSYKETSMPGL